MKGKILLIVFIVIQIITESLPISSSGHIALLARMLSSSNATCMEALQTPLHIAHMPTVGIVIVMLRQRWIFLLRHLSRCKKNIIRLFLYGALAEMTTLVIYLAGGKMYKSFAGDIKLWWGFMLTACALASITIKKNVPYQRMSLAYVYSILGCAQGCAVFPGVSRLGITYVAGIWCGLSPKNAFYYAWTLAIPIYVVVSMGEIWLHPTAWYIFYEYRYIMYRATLIAGLLFWATRAVLLRRWEGIFVIYLLVVAAFAMLLMR